MVWYAAAGPELVQVVPEYYSVKKVLAHTSHIFVFRLFDFWLYVGHFDFPGVILCFVTERGTQSFRSDFCMFDNESMGWLRTSLYQ